MTRLMTLTAPATRRGVPIANVEAPRCGKSIGIFHVTDPRQGRARARDYKEFEMRAISEQKLS
ncbi:MAG: hypothetical protein WBC37_04265, partial [Burkholderiaceae bacterium]